MVAINVTVRNEGETIETFNVTVYANKTKIGEQKMLDLTPNKNATLIFSWNTTQFSAGRYLIKAVAETLPYEEDSTDNTYTSGYVEVKGTHDIAVISINPSVQEAYVGQIISISVVVKNEGTVAETFTVTIYLNETVIEFQEVSNLQPSEEKNLTFYWNTTSFSGNSRYVIKAVASLIQEETDTLDNTLESRAIILKSPDKRGALQLPMDLSNGISLGLISVFLLSIGLVWRKRRSRPKLVGFEFFDKITNGGIPEASSVMITGSPSSGKSVLAQQLAFNHLKSGKTCIYVSYDCFPVEVRQSMENFLWNISTYEKDGSFCFIDCYSQIAGVKTNEKYSVDQPYSLSDLGITISEAMKNVGAKSPMVVLDSTAPLFARIDSAKVLEFIQDRGARIKGEKGIFIFIVGKGTVSANHMNKLEEIVDCIIELQEIEERGKIIRRLRIKKLRGRNFVDEWIPFKIDSKSGIVFLIGKRK
jgi:KaiC/GvpD/RAD55 family RecA-like ATPase